MSQYVLLDSGEGTLGQMARTYGPHLDQVLMRLHFVFISHLHADHHLGLIEIILERQEAFRREGVDCPPPIVVLGPAPLRLWLKAIQTRLHPFDMTFLDW